MSEHIVTLPLFTEVQAEFNKRYPFLKIELQFNPGENTVNVSQNTGSGAGDFLTRQIGLNDNMTIPDLVEALQQYFGRPVTVFRKSCFTWMETIMSREWSLRQHNDHGREVSTRFQ
ncbi:MAG TPA: hypothetical protein VL727_06290 [Puia sp.]|jgi:hypothetical protein|nr:hypothetical protein [Puia sp.]